MMGLDKSQLGIDFIRGWEFCSPICFGRRGFAYDVRCSCICFVGTEMRKEGRKTINYLMTLPSQMTMIWDDYGSIGTTAIAFFVRVGSRDEPKDQYGAAHFLEHAVFKGAGNWSARDIAGIQDQLGGEINAFTTRDYTVYYAKVLSSKASEALELLWTLISAPFLESSDIDKERHVILEELLEAQDDLEDRSSELYVSALFPDPDFHHDVLGTKETIQNFKAQDLRDFHRQFYFPGNIVAVLAGDGVDQLRRQLQSFSWPKSGHSRPLSRQPVFHQPRVRMLQKAGEQVHLTMGIAAPLLDDVAHDATLILTTILAGQNTSRLWQRLREEEGLVYTVSASYSALKDWAELSVYMALSPGSVPRALEVARDEIQQLVLTPPSSRERDLALTQAETSMAFAMETPDGRVMRLGLYALYGMMPLDPRERLSQLEQVTCDEIRVTAHRLFHGSPWAIGASGPVDSIRPVLNQGFTA